MSHLTKLILLISLVFTTFTSWAAERILSFDSRISLNSDRSINVTETIRVSAEGNQIKRGIFRDIPTTEGGIFGGRRRVKLKVISVTKDGLPENYEVTSISGNDLSSSGQRIRIGNKDIFLNRGIYEYQIKYQMSGQVRSYDTYDEVYWNVTGNGWDFSIEKASAQIQPPANFQFSTDSSAAYTGSAGSSGKDFRSWTDPAGSIHFQTTRMLFSNEGLTIAAKIDKGFFSEPGIFDWILQYLDIFIGVFGLAGLVTYYYKAWDRVGRDPKQKTIIPRYDIPAKISAADLRYLYNMGFDSKVFTASIIGLAVKGFLTITNKNSSYSLQKAKDPNYSQLTNDEIEVANALFPTGVKTVSVDKSSRSRILKAQNALKKSLQDEHLKINFVNNRQYFFTGLIITVGVYFLILLTQPWQMFISIAFISFWLGIWTTAVLVFAVQALACWRGRQYLTAIPLTLGFLPFLFGEIVGIGFLVAATSIPFVCILILFGIVNFLFLNLLKAPTMAGASIRDHIKGLKLYLETAEKDRFASIAAPDQTLAHFEELFPFALALNVEQKWSEKFADEIAKAALVPSSNAHRNLHWYNSSHKSFSASDFGSGLSSSFSSALSSSVATSSSGSSGGGSSGGGGGGGGGGGW